MFEHEILKYILTFISCYMLAKNTVQTGSATFGHFYLMAQTETLIARDRGARARAARRRGHAARQPSVFIKPKAMMFVLGSTCAPFRPSRRP
jgi:hypothetical protein